jgi:hypothetical protein
MAHNRQYSDLSDISMQTASDDWIHLKIYLVQASAAVPE